MLRISILYKSIYRAHEKLTTNEVKLQIKRDEISKIGGPESKIKVAEIDAMLEKLRLQREMIMQKKNDALEKIKNPGFFRAGAIFGLNQDMLDRLIIMKNTQEKIVVADIKMKSAQKVLTDNEINELKRRIISLKARDTKYTEELKRTEANIIKSMETEEVTGGDVEIKKQLDGVLRKIADVESDIAKTKEEISVEKDEKKKEVLVRSYAKDEKYLKTLDQEKNDIMVKAKEAILGSTSKES
jgi:hypothetical protein